jgi:hypothetical protein
MDMALEISEPKGDQNGLRWPKSEVHICLYLYIQLHMKIATSQYVCFVIWR